MPEPSSINRDEEHLRLLSLFHFVCAGMVALFAFFPIIHLVLGLLMILSVGVLGEGKQQPPVIIGWFFVVLSSVCMWVGWTLAALLAWSGQSLRRRKGYLFCLVMACVACFFMPFGTVLGIFTIIVLIRPSVKALFESKAAVTQTL